MQRTFFWAPFPAHPGSKLTNILPLSFFFRRLHSYGIQSLFLHQLLQGSGRSAVLRQGWTPNSLRCSLGMGQVRLKVSLFPHTCRSVILVDIKCPDTWNESNDEIKYSTHEHLSCLMQKKIPIIQTRTNGCKSENVEWSYPGPATLNIPKILISMNTYTNALYRSLAQ